MVAFSDIIDFLLRLMSDETARADFEQDPQGSLGRLAWRASGPRTSATRACIWPTPAPCTPPTTAAAPPRTHRRPGPRDRPHHRALHRDERTRRSGRGSSQGDTFLTIDDRDKLFFQSISDNDITMTDDHSVNTVLAIQDNDVNVSDDDVHIDAEESFNTDNDVVAIQDNDINGGDVLIDIDETGGVRPTPVRPPRRPGRRPWPPPSTTT